VQGHAAMSRSISIQRSLRGHPFYTAKPWSKLRAKRKAPAQSQGEENSEIQGPLSTTSSGPQMSIHITSTAQWFRCMSLAATLQERHAALAKLVRMLVGDTARPRPPISLAGRPTIPTPPPPSAASAPVPVTHPRPLGRTPREKAVEPSNDDADAREPYSREQLERMDRRFVERLERAIKRGQEHRL
jgi:hypothetical protein